jgi:hypothetical protein
MRWNRTRSPGEEAEPARERQAEPRWLIPVLGCVAGLVSWTVGEAFVGYFSPPVALMDDLGASAELGRQQIASDLKNACVAFGWLGAILGLALGFAGGMTRRSTAAAGKAAALGLILGGCSGVGLSLFLLPIYERNRDMISDDMVLPILIHCGIWGGIGASTGLAFGIGRGGGRQIVNSLCGALVGALVASVLFDILGALLFPVAQTARPISVTSGTRLLARLLVAMLAAVGAMKSLGVDVPPLGGTNNRPIADHVLDPG